MEACDCALKPARSIETARLIRVFLSLLRGLSSIPPSTHGLRPGLHYPAVSRLVKTGCFERG